MFGFLIRFLGGYTADDLARATNLAALQELARLSSDLNRTKLGDVLNSHLQTVETEVEEFNLAADNQEQQIQLLRMEMGELQQKLAQALAHATLLRSDAEELEAAAVRIRYVLL